MARRVKAFTKPIEESESSDNYEETENLDGNIIDSSESEQTEEEIFSGDDSDDSFEVEQVVKPNFKPKVAFPQPTVKSLAPMTKGKTIVPITNTKPKIKLNVAKPTVDRATIERIGQEMRGINLEEIEASEFADVNDILFIEPDETETEFQARSTLTHKILDVAELEFSNLAAVVVAFMMMKKAKLGVTYDNVLESLLKRVRSLL